MQNGFHDTSFTICNMLWPNSKLQKMQQQDITILAANWKLQQSFQNNIDNDGLTWF